MISPNIQLEVMRFSSQKNCTRGLLFDISNDKREFLCYTLEDEYRDEKVMHETRVPAGEYEITLRTEGGFHQRYEKRFPTIHGGMLWVRNVPGFEYILIHCGNDSSHTSGCLLVGETQKSNFVGGSTNAYKKIYPELVQALTDRKRITIKYTDYDTV